MNKEYKKQFKEKYGFLPIGGGLGGLFGGDDEGGGDGGGGSVSPQPQIPGWQSMLGEDLSSWVRKFLPSYSPGQPYGGKLSVKEPSRFEQIGLEQLGGLLGQPATGDIFGAAKGQIMDTLGGRYADPSTSPFIQAATKLAGQNLRDSIDLSRGQRGARGTFFTRSGLQEESRLTERTQNSLNAIIGDFINQERGRQLTAVPYAKELEQYSLDAPLKKIAASQSLGSLPRILEQADLERQYADFNRQRGELSGIPNIGASVLSKAVPYGFNELTSPRVQQPSFLDQVSPWVDVAIKAAPFIMRAFCWVAAEVFDGWNDRRTYQARAYVAFIAPKWFKRIYIKYGEKIAKIIKKMPKLKNVFRPIFDNFAQQGEKLFMQFEGGSYGLQ